MSLYWPYPENTETSYEIRLIGSTSGIYVDEVDRYTELSYTLVVNDVGNLTLNLPGDYPRTNLLPDARLEVWRKVGYGPLKLEGDTQFIIQEIARGADSSGGKFIQVIAPTVNSILKRRVVPYNNDGSAYVEMVNYSEYIMKYIVYYNMTAGAVDTARAIPQAIFYTDPAAGNTISSTVGSQFAHKIVMDSIKELADQSFQLGYPLYYDVVALTPPTGLQFRVFATRGNDRRYSAGKSQLILGYEYGNLGSYTIREQYQDEVTFVYCAGPGEDDMRSVITVEDTVRSGRSVFGRRELWEDFQDGDTDVKLTSRANALLAANRPKKIFEAELLNQSGTLYGVHWGFGDWLTASADGEAFDAVVAAVQVGVKEKKETVGAGLRSIT